MPFFSKWEITPTIGTNGLTLNDLRVYDSAGNDVTATADVVPSVTPTTGTFPSPILTSQVVIDEKLHTVTTVGNVVLSDDVFKFGNASAYFDGLNSYLDIVDSVDFGFGTDNFTVEFWLNLSALAPVDDMQLVDFRTGLGENGLIYLKGGTGTLSYYNGVDYPSTGSITINTWTHVAVVREAGVLKFFIGGVAKGTVALADDFGTSRPCRIGANFVGTGGMNGYIDDFRVTKVVARYTANFTPAISEFVNVQQPPSILGDDLFSNVSTLLHFNGTNGSTAFTDVISSNAWTINSGSPTISTTMSKWGGSSFKGGPDYGIYTPSNTAFGLNSDFTVETWFYVTSWSPTYQTIANIGSYSSGALFRVQSGTIELYMPGGGAVNKTASVTAGVWHHIAWTRQAGNIRVFLDGVQAGTTSSNTVAIPANYVLVGRSAHTTGEYLNGYIDDFRITKGVARYTANFTPPTEQFLDYATVIYPGDPFWDNTTAAMHLNTYCTNPVTWPAGTNLTFNLNFPNKENIVSLTALTPDSTMLPTNFQVRTFENGVDYNSALFKSTLTTTVTPTWSTGYLNTTNKLFFNGHQYWRVSCYANTYNTQIQELQLRDRRAGMNMCSGGTPISSTANATYPASKAFDGDIVNIANRFESSVAGWNWIGYNFGKKVDITELVMYTCPAGAGISYNYHPDFLYLEWSNDGTNWVTANSSIEQINSGIRGYAEKVVYNTHPGVYYEEGKALSHVYWRLFLDSTYGNHTTLATSIAIKGGVGGCSFRDTITGTNLALNGTAIGNSLSAGSYAGAFNGVTPHWLADHERAWVGVQLNTAADVNYIVYWPQANNVRNWRLEWSDDGELWITKFKRLSDNNLNSGPDIGVVHKTPNLNFLSGTVAPHYYWRVVPLANSNSTSISAIQNIGFLDENMNCFMPDFHGSSIAAGTINGNQHAWRAHSGGAQGFANDVSGWQTTTINTSSNYIGVKSNKPFSPKYILLQGYQDSTNRPYNTYSFLLQWSDDGVAWTSHGRYNGNTQNNPASTYLTTFVATVPTVPPEEGGLDTISTGYKIINKNEQVAFDPVVKTVNPIIAKQMVMDNTYHTEIRAHKIYGHVEHLPAGLPLKRSVLLYTAREMILVAQTWSREADGYYEFTFIPDTKYTVIVKDYTNTYNATVRDNCSAVPM